MQFSIRSLLAISLVVSLSFAIWQRYTTLQRATSVLQEAQIVHQQLTRRLQWDMPGVKDRHTKLFEQEAILNEAVEIAQKNIIAVRQKQIDEISFTPETFAIQSFPQLSWVGSKRELGLITQYHLNVPATRPCFLKVGIIKSTEEPPYSSRILDSELLAAESFQRRLSAQPHGIALIHSDETLQIKIDGLTFRFPFKTSARWMVAAIESKQTFNDSQRLPVLGLQIKPNRAPQGDIKIEIDANGNERDQRWLAVWLSDRSSDLQPFPSDPIEGSADQ
ncbi:hypothetical protein LOC67_13615 [Stieleria sp. JC731]|uniref:hypothetical protein n=1 Tax=Pirellulaceae TaxID=2691357 RepID=UPI001E60B1E7|nr:hypothetical protein [Stieleria sp. JC731]MCC9601590.1 hypothetical protein [Stieleria sp. JC731]